MGTDDSSSVSCPDLSPECCSQWLLVTLTRSTGGPTAKALANILQGKMPRHGGGPVSFLLENWAKSRPHPSTAQPGPRGEGASDTHSGPGV